MNKNIILAKTYDLLKVGVPFVSRLPKAHKFTFGDRLLNLLWELLEDLIEASYSPAKEKRQLLLKVNINLEKLRYYFRIGFDLGLYPSKKYRDFAQRLDEIGRMCGGWLKSL